MGMTFVGMNGLIEKKIQWVFLSAAVVCLLSPLRVAMAVCTGGGWCLCGVA